jgi:hypothetical protein
MEATMSDRTSLYEEWRAYHEMNPQVYQLICKYAQEVIDRGWKKYAIATIWERLRWHVTVEVQTADDFTLPNNHRAYYARYWLEQHPEHPDFFQTCALRSEGEGGPFDRWGQARDDGDDEGAQPDLF